MGGFASGSPSELGGGGFDLGSLSEPGIDSGLLSLIEARLFSMDGNGDAHCLDWTVNSQFQSRGDNRSLDRLVGEDAVLLNQSGGGSLSDSMELPDCEFQVDAFTPDDFFVPDLPPPGIGGEIHMQVDPTLQSATDFVSGLPLLLGNEDCHTQAVYTTDLENAMEKLQIEDVMQDEPAARRWPVLEPCKSIGITQRRNGTWEAHIWLKDFNLDRSRNGMQFFVGSFGSKEDAKRAHDKAAIKLDVRVKKDGTAYSLNYPEEQYEDYIAEHALWSRRDYLWKMRRDSEKFSTGACSLKGVRFLKNRKGKVTGRYTATTSVTSKSNSTESEKSPADGKNSPISKLKKNKKFLALGSFETEEEAGRAYDKALLFIQGMYSGCVTNFQPGNYSETEVLEVGRKLKQVYPKVDFKGHETTLECLLHDS